MRTKTRVKRSARTAHGAERTESSARDEQAALLKARGKSRQPVEEPGGTPPAIDEPEPIEGPVEDDAHAQRPGRGPDTNS